MYIYLVCVVYILYIYPTTLLHLFISPDGLFVASLGFCVFKVMSPANNFASSFPVFMPFIYFSCLISLANISSTMPNISGKSRTFQSFTIRHDINCGFFIDVLYQVEEVPLYSFLSVFIVKDYQFVECFSCIYWDDHVVFVLY